MVRWGFPGNRAGSYQEEAMARPNIPNYPIDGEAVYIPEDDDAWDHERIERERPDREGNDDDAHPCDRYWRGETRARLEPVTEYLDMSKVPEQWYLEDTRFPPGPRREMDAHVARAMRASQEGDQVEASEQWSRAFLVAFRWGIRRVENPPTEIKRRRDGAISDETIATIDRIAPGLVTEIGAVVLRAIQPLTEAEGKR